MKRLFIAATIHRRAFLIDTMGTASNASASQSCYVKKIMEHYSDLQTLVSRALKLMPMTPKPIPHVRLEDSKLG